MTFKDYWCSPEKYGTILKLAVPLVLSNAGLVFMQFVDTVLIGKYSPEAIAAIGMSSMMSWLIACFFAGAVGYTSVVTANNIGAGYDEKIGSGIWQGVFLAAGGALFALFLSFFVTPFFELCGHEGNIRQWESDYLRILLYGSFPFLASCALSGFFSGRGDNVRLMLAQLAGQIANIFLDYAMIFGKFGFPEMGVSGAAWATSLSELLPVVIMCGFFFCRRNREKYHTLAWRPNRVQMVNLIRFGSANGFVGYVDTLFWAVFLVVTGRIGTVAMAATTIAFRLNNLSFMPVIGLARAMGTLTGNANGARDYENVRSYMCHGMVLSEIWMGLVAISFVCWPNFYLQFFSHGDGSDPESFREIAETTIVLMRFVAIYSVGDAINVSMMSGLCSVGDTKWTSIIMTVFSGTLTALMFVAAAWHWSLYSIWTFATAYVLALPVLWLWRLKSGAWMKFRVATD